MGCVWQLCLYNELCVRYGIVVSFLSMYGFRNLRSSSRRFHKWFHTVFMPSKCLAIVDLVIVAIVWFLSVTDSSMQSVSDSTAFCWLSLVGSDKILRHQESCENFETRNPTITDRIRSEPCIAFFDLGGEKYQLSKGKNNCSK